MSTGMTRAFLPKVVILLLLSISLPLQALPEIQHWQAKKGVQAYLVQTEELPMIDIQIMFDAGSARDGELPGIASLTAALLDKGAAGMDADALGVAFDSIGAQFSAAADRDYASVRLRSLSGKRQLPMALETLKSILSAPEFSAVAVQREINRQRTAVEYKKQSPESIATDALAQAIYGKHPYAHPTEGTVESLAKINAGRIRAFYEKYYVARNAVIVLVGNVNLKQAKFIANALFADLPAGEAPPALPMPEAVAAAGKKTIPYPSTQTHVLMGQLGTTRLDEDYLPLYLGNHILGGSGMVSRLFDQVREKRGLSYSVYSYFLPRPARGYFIATLQTQQAQAEEALQVLTDNILEFVEKGPSEAELQAAKKNITGGFPLRVANNRNILEYVSMIAWNKLPLDYLNTFVARIEAVSAEQIRQAFQRRLQLEQMAIVMVGGATTEQKAEQIQ